MHYIITSHSGVRLRKRLSFEGLVPRSRSRSGIEVIFEVDVYYGGYCLHESGEASRQSGPAEVRWGEGGG